MFHLLNDKCMKIKPLYRCFYSISSFISAQVRREYNGEKYVLKPIFDSIRIIFMICLFSIYYIANRFDQTMIVDFLGEV